MVVKKKAIRDNIISRKRAASHAATNLHIGVLTRTMGMADWRGAHLGRSKTVYDLNDEPLFYDFPVLSRKRKRLGLIRASASRVAGVPVPSVQIGAAVLDVDEASQKAAKVIMEKEKGKVVGTKLVCYAYPKLGIAVQSEKRGEPQRTIVDVGDFSIVPEKVEPEMRGPGAVSSYDRIEGRDVPKAIRDFEQYDRVVDELQERSGKDLSTALKLYEFDAVQVTLGKFVKPSLFYTRRLTFCTHDFSHECFRIHSQETGVWCVVATGQMILDFWRYYSSQTDIAAAMGTGTGGTSYAGEVSGYESITCSHFDAQSDFSPTIEKAIAEIRANRPFDYSYSYHAMACAGYRNLQFQIVPLLTPQYSLLLYDPSPVNMGTIRWETWGAGISPVDGFVYLRRT